MSSGTSRKRITLADATAAELTDLRFLGHPNGMWWEFLERGTFLPVCYAFGLMFVCVGSVLYIIVSGAISDHCVS